MKQCLDEIHCSTHNEYSLRAKGILHEFEKFEMLFGLKMGHLYTLEVWRKSPSAFKQKILLLERQLKLGIQLLQAAENR